MGRGSLSGLIAEKQGLKMPGTLLKPTDLNSLLIFEKLCDDWVREVHKFNSERKKKKSYVVFRNCQNRKLTSLEELKEELEDVSFLENAVFKSAFSHDIVSNKVGANKIARRAAKAWMADPNKQVPKPRVVKAEAIEKQTTAKSLPAEEPVEIAQPIENVVESPQITESLPIKEEATPIEDQFVEELDVEEVVAEEPVTEIIEQIREAEVTTALPVKEEPSPIEEPVAEVVEEPISEEPAAEEPVTEEHIAEETIAEEIITKETLTEEPIDENPVVVEDAAVEEIIVQESVIEEQATKEPGVGESVTEEPICEEKVVEEAAIEKVIIEEAVTEDVAIVQESVTEDVAIVQESVTEDPATKEPVAEETIAKEPLKEEPNDK